MTRPLPCPVPGTFDISRSAEVHAQTAGVLAGFAFVALIFVLTEYRREGGQGSVGKRREYASEQNHIVVSLMCAFLGLVITTFLYAVLASEQGQALVQGRASSEELLSGIAFAFSVTALLYAVVLLVSGAGLKHTGHEVRAIVAVTVPPLAALLIGLAAHDVAFARVLKTATHPWPPAEPLCTGHAFLDDINTWSVGVMPTTVFGCCLLLWAASRRSRWSAWEHSLRRASGKYVRNGLPKSSLLMAVAAAVWSSMMSGQEPSAGLPPVAVWCLLGVVHALLVAQAAYMLWASPGEPLASNRYPGPG